MNAWHGNVRVGAVGDGLKTIEGKWWVFFSSSEVVIALPSRMTFGSGGDNHNNTMYNEDICG